MKVTTLFCALSVALCLTALAVQPVPTARISKVVVRNPHDERLPANTKEISVQLSFSSAEDRVRKPILVVYLLTDNQDGSIGQATFFSLDLTDGSFLPQGDAYSQLMTRIGTPTDSFPKIYVEWEKLLGDASKAGVPVDKKGFVNATATGPVALPPIKKVLAMRGELWFDGQVIGKYEQVDRTATKVKIPADWYVYAKYPDQFLYSVFWRKSYTVSFVNIQSLLQGLEKEKKK